MLAERFDVDAVRSETPRAPTPREVELSVLDKSRRRCALCFHLKNDLLEKHGQIAHLDDNRSNANEDNLAFLCLGHHSLYDSGTSQHKGYTIDEAKKARNALYEAIEKGLHLGVELIRYPDREADRHTFNLLLKVLPSDGSIYFMREFSFGNCFRWEALKDLDDFRYACARPEHEFLDETLEAQRTTLLKCVDKFVHLLAGNSFRLEGSIEDAYYKVPDDWHHTNPKRWHEAVDAINTAADAVIAQYDTFVRECRRKLLG
jgi:hypothetical protein